MLSNAFIPELKYRLYFWKCRPRSEDSVEMEQLKSHLRAGRHECQFYFTYSRAFLVLCLNCFAGCRPRLFCSNSLLSHRTDCRFFQLMLPKWQKSSGSLKLHCLCVIGVGPLSQSASEKHNQEKKAHIPLRTSWISPQNLSAMFDNHAILLLWLSNKQNVRMFSLLDLCFVLCSLDLNVLRAQRIMGFFILITRPRPKRPGAES